MFIPNHGDAEHQSSITFVGNGSGAHILSKFLKNSGMFCSFTLDGFSKTLPSPKNTNVVSICIYAYTFSAKCTLYSLPNVSLQYLSNHFAPSLLPVFDTRYSKSLLCLITFAASNTGSPSNRVGIDKSSL